MANDNQPEEQILYSEPPEPPPPAVPSRRSRLLLLTGLIPVLAYAGYVWRWAFDAPLMDDITLADTVNQFAEEGFASLGTGLMAQLNDHRIVFSRLAALVAYGLSGYLNVRAVALVGYANLLLLGWLLWRLFRTTGLKPVYFLPAPFLLFSPYLYQISLWGLVSFQPPLATAFSLASLLVLNQPRRWGWAVLLALMGLFAGGNGLMAFVAGGFLLLVQRRFRHLVGWMLFTGAALTLYFDGYRFSSASQVAGDLPEVLRALFVNTIAFVGSPVTVFSESKGMPLSLVLGGGVVLLSAGLFWRKLVPSMVQNRWTARLKGVFPAPTSALLLAALLCLLGTAGLIALVRSSGGAQEMLSDRFHLYSAVLLIVFYLALVASLNPTYRRWALLAALPVAVLTNAYAYLQYRPIRDTMTEGMAADAYNFWHHRVFLHQYPDFTDPRPEKFLHCRFPVTFSETAARHLVQLARRGQGQVGVHAQVTRLQRPVAFRVGLFPYLEVDIDAPPGVPLPDERVWLFLVDKSKANAVFFLAARRQKAPLTEYLRTGRFYINRFSATVPRKMAAGSYHLGLCWFRDGRVAGLCTPGLVGL